MRHGRVGNADRVTKILWAARARMSYLPELYTYEDPLVD
jgi:hypothetical protein